PDADETTQSLQEKFPAPDIFSHIELADGRVWLKPNGVSSFAGDLPEHEQKLVWATHAAPTADLFNQKVEGTAWRSKPKLAHRGHEGPDHAGRIGALRRKAHGGNNLRN